MKTTRTPQNYCRTCHYRMDAASSATKPDEIPDAGSVSLCMKCGELSIFNEDLTLRAPTEQELINIQRSLTWPEIERHRMAIRWMQDKIARGELPPFYDDRVNGKKQP